MIAVPASDLSNQRMRRARQVTIGVVILGVLASLVLTGVGLSAERDPVRVALGAVGLLVFVAGLAGALYRAVTPWLDRRTGRLLLYGFAAAAVLSIPLTGPAGAGESRTWAFLSSAIVGWAPLLLRTPAAVAAMVATTAMSAAVGWWFGGAPVTYAAITAALGLSVAAWNGLYLWLWRFLVQAQDGREALTRLAATEERLRFARDVHDLLGHNLSVIALKAELASRLAPVDPARASHEAAEVRRLATAALTEMREVVHGYRAVNLRDQANAVTRVLRSSGVRCEVSQPDTEVPAELAGPLVATLREASTNVLRHSQAQWCTITIDHDDAEARMTIVNDGVGDAHPDEHSHGLRGLAERLRDAGGTLHTEQKNGMFTLEATVRARP